MNSDNLFIRSSSLASSLVSDGFAVVPMIDEKALVQISTLFAECCGGTDTPQIFNTLTQCPPEVKRRIHMELKTIFAPFLNNYFDNYKNAISLFFVVHPSTSVKEKVDIHQDPTLIMDDGEIFNLKIWVPLVNTDEQNGGMQVLRGSHKFFPPVQAVTIPSPFSNLSELDDLHESIPIKAGEAMIFDNRLIHGSMPNFSSQTRVAVAISIIPLQAQPISMFLQQGVKKPHIEVYFQEDEWHLNPEWDNTFQPPKIGRKQGYLDYEAFTVNRTEFIDLVKNPRPYRNFKFKIIPEKKPNFFAQLKELVGAG
jgi:hypothetical protein